MPSIRDLTGPLEMYRDPNMWTPIYQQTVDATRLMGASVIVTFSHLVPMRRDLSSCRHPRERDLSAQTARREPCLPIFRVIRPEAALHAPERRRVRQKVPPALRRAEAASHVILGGIDEVLG